MIYKSPKIISILFTLLCFVTATTAYNVQYSDETKSQQLSWQSKKIPITFSRSLLNQSSISKDEVLRAVDSSLATWENVADIQFVETWSDDNSVSPLGKSGDGVNLITISQTAENLLLFNGNTSENAARTRVFYNRKGNITEADIVLNPYTMFTTDGTFGTYDLESVLTHELGHLLGLEHSDVLAATMFPNQGKNGVYNLQSFSPRTLSADDISGIRSIYGVNADEVSCCGSISGNISGLNKNAAKVFKVFAENSETGNFTAEVLTDKNGNYVFDGLSTGNYILYSKSAESDNSSVEKLGTIEVFAGKNVVFNKKTRQRSKDFALQYIGFNGQIANLAVPLNSGKSYVVYVAGKNLNTENLTAAVQSPFIKINPKSFTSHNYGSDISVVSFELILQPDIPKGDYSLSLIDKNGNTDYLFGCLSVEQMSNPWFSYIF